ncbi:MAG: TatD family hydrolase [Muribaculaceae bacterium]|nr:TatD family hydrolase [Muribaculaceae bacterium]
MIADAHSHKHSADAIVNIGIGDTIVGDACSIGVHPWNTTDHSAAIRDLETLAQRCSDERVVAIGEAGLDRLRGGDMEFQLAVFLAQVELSEKTGKPLIIHTVRTLDEILKTRQTSGAMIPWILHGFRGGVAKMDKVLSAGLHLSIGENFSRETVAAIPDDELIIETDESTLSIREIAANVAKARNTTADAVMTLSAKNIARIFGFPTGV